VSDIHFESSPQTASSKTEKGAKSAKSIPISGTTQLDVESRLASESNGGECLSLLISRLGP
jgi:hypothetical protein